MSFNPKLPQRHQNSAPSSRVIPGLPGGGAHHVAQDKRPQLSLLFAVETSLTIQLFSWKLANCVCVHLEQLFQKQQKPFHRNNKKPRLSGGAQLRSFQVLGEEVWECSLSKFS